MEKPTIVWLMRHGLPQGVEGRCYGRHDICLSAEGIGQAKGLSARLAAQPLAKVYSSPLRRAVETAQIVAEPHHLPVEMLDALSEIHFGDFEGLGYDEIEMRYPELFQSWMERPTETRFPNGEDFQEMRRRVLDALNLLLTRHSKEPIAIIAHAGVIRVLVAQALSIPDSQIFRLAQRYAALNRIDYFEHGAVVEMLNGCVAAATGVSV